MTAVMALGFLVLLIPVIVLAIILVGAWREGRRSPYAFGIGRVISNSFGAIGGAPFAFILVGLVLSGLPALTVGILNADLMRTSELAEVTISRFGASYGALFLLRMLLLPFAQGVLILVSLDVLAERAVDLRRALTIMLRLWIFAIGLVILCWIGIGIGMLLLVIPGLILSLNWFVALPVLVAERAGVLESFGRSAALLRGMRWRLSLLLVIALVLWFFAALVGGVLQAALPGSWMIHVEGVVGATLVGMIVPAMIAAVYHEVRTAKEGSGSHDLSDVFA